MTFLDRIAECNQADLSRYVPFFVADQRMGWVRCDRLAVLEDVASGLVIEADRVAVAPELSQSAARSAALRETVDRLTERGEVRGYRGELYPVRRRFADVAACDVERAAVSYFGAKAWGIHLNGFVRRGDRIDMWIARRARDKVTYPGMLDNMVAGGQPAGLSLQANLIKECGEEADVPPELAATARPVGTVTYVMENDHGIKPDCMFCYDLELPSDFVPRGADGEVESFELMPIDEVAAIVRDSREFKFNCNLVIIDFLLRHGLLDADDSDFERIAGGLQQGEGG